MFVGWDRHKKIHTVKTVNIGIDWDRIASHCQKCNLYQIVNTVKILKIGTPEIITIIVLQLEQLDFTVQYCVQKMQTE